MTVFYAVYYSRFTRVDSHGKFFWEIFLTFFVGKSTQNFLKINSSRTYFQNFVQRLEHCGTVFHTHTHAHTHTHTHTHTNKYKKTHKQKTLK